jgi:hypothetical protein
MKRIAIALTVALAVPSLAQARVHTIAPPGNSGVGQYVETVPTADGGQPTSTVHHSGGAGGSEGGGGTGGGPGFTGGAIAASTQRALAKQGATGAATAAVAEATAPRRARPAARSGNAQAQSSISPASDDQGSPPSSSVIKALTGSTSGGGLGPLLPIVLIGSVLAAGVLTLVRRRRTS